METKREWSLEDKICLITGASSGIGKAVAIELLRRGAEVVAVCRHAERGQTAVEEIRAAAGTDRIRLLRADLASQADIRQMVHELKARYAALHVLINNAAESPAVRELTTDGIEKTLAVNTLAPHLLFRLLEPMLRASAPARVINVVSEGEWFARLDLDDIELERRRYHTMRAYGQSKLALIMLTYETARRLRGSGVTVNCWHPGPVATNFGGMNSGVSKVILTLARPIMATPERGVAPLVYLASSPEVQNVTGRYFKKWKQGRSRPQSYDPKLAGSLWARCETLVRLDADN